MANLKELSDKIEQHVLKREAAPAHRAITALLKHFLNLNPLIVRDRFCLS
jgi:hypothetical protein